MRGRLRSKQANGFLGHRLHDRIGVDAVEALDRMRHRVHAARRRDARRQIERQFRIVDRGRRQRRQIVLSRNTLIGDADIPARRHFRAGIGGDDGDIRQLGRGRRGLGEPDRRAAADHDEAVGIVPLDVGKDALERVARHVLARGVAEADDAVGDRGGDAAREIGARLRAQHHKPRHFVQFGFRGERADGAGAEHDAHRIGAVGEGGDHDPLHVIPEAEATGPAFGRPDDRLREAVRNP